jgi:Pectate lyase superfamily protein
MTMNLIRLPIVLALLLVGCLPAAAQGCGQSNPNCIVPTAPAGTSDERAASTAFVQQEKPFVIITDAPFNADPTGVLDSTAAIQAAINSLPTSGGDVIVPVGNYRITSALTIGNGTSSIASTRQGVVLVGVGNPRTGPIFAGFTVTGGPKLTWAGSGAAGVIAIKGPLQGWGIQNLNIDCASITSSVGINITSAQFGDNRGVTFNNCFRTIISTTVATFGSFTNTDSFHNDFYGTVIQMPAIAGSIGILLTGAAGGTSNTDYNTFIDTWIALPTTNVLAQGVLLQSSDTNHFINTHMSGGSASAQCVAFDYSVVTSFPSSNRFTGVDTAGTCGGGAGATIGGTPAAGAKPNIVFPDGGNNTTCINFAVNNVSCFSFNELYTNPGGNNAGTDIFAAWTAFTMNPVCGTATITPTSARAKVLGKTTFVEYDLNITALGTCTNTLTVNLPNTANTGGAVNGRAASSGKGVALQISGGGVTAVGTQSDATNFGTGQILLSGVYENQ